MSDQYLACFPTAEQTHSVWVFDSRSEFITRVLELLVRERLDAWEDNDHPPPELEARVQSFCAMAAPIVVASGRWDASAFLDALDAAFPFEAGFVAGPEDGLQWAGAAADLLKSEVALALHFREEFQQRRGTTPTLESLEEFLEFLLEEWP